MASSSTEVGSLAVAGPASREEAVSGVTAEYPDTSKLYPGKSWIRGYADTRIRSERRPQPFLKKW